jgi:hypothetical protein
MPSLLSNVSLYFKRWFFFLIQELTFLVIRWSWNPRISNGSAAGKQTSLLGLRHVKKLRFIIQISACYTLPYSVPMKLLTAQEYRIFLCIGVVCCFMDSVWCYNVKQLIILFQFQDANFVGFVDPQHTHSRPHSHSPFWNLARTAWNQLQNGDWEWGYLSCHTVNWQ